MNWPFITVAMPVRNEEAFIEETLRQLLEQDYPADRFEIIVADACSEDSTRQIVEALSRKYPQVILKTNRRELSSSGRNVGFQNGRGEYFIVVDGHCRIDNRDFLKNVAEAFLKSGAECLGRPQPFVIPEQPTWQRAIAIARTSRLGHSSRSFIHADEEAFVSPVSMGCAYKKEVFEIIGFVDEAFDACEDVEFNYRVEQAGFKTFFTPKIAVQYFPRENLKGLWRQMIRYGSGRTKFMFKHPKTTSFDMLLLALFSLGIALGPFSFLIHPYLFAFYPGVILIYLILLTLESLRLRKKEPLSFVLKLMTAFFVIHFSLGAGILNGLIRKFFKPAHLKPGRKDNSVMETS
ncbi:MAG: glycosyltransferase family 2 protein [Calditrichia bacterium]